MKKNQVFIISMAICAIISAWGIFFSSHMEVFLQRLFDSLTNNLNWLILLSAMFFLVFVLSLAFGKYGNIRLGKEDDKPEYDRFTWFSMMFTAGMGIGLLFWSIAEPITHYINPPYGEAYTNEALEIGLSYTFFHWGLHPWGIYAFGGLALAYFQFNKGLPCLISSIFYPLLKNNIKGWMGKTIDIVAIIATVVGLTVSLGLGVIQINSGLNFLFNIPDINLIKILIIIVITFMFTMVGVSGLKRGIRSVANGTVYTSMLLLVFLLILGPTNFIIDIVINTTGYYLQNIIRMSLWTDSFNDSNWVNNWTVFYWAWWIAWVPCVGQFIARISKGRTIKEFVLGAIISPTLFSIACISIFSGAGIYAMLNMNHQITVMVKENVALALFTTLNCYPIPLFTSSISILLISGFFITSACSGIFVLGMFSSGGNNNPGKGIRLIWGLMLGIVSAALLFAGGLKGLQNASLIVAFPFMLIMFLMGFCLIRQLKEDSSVETSKESDPLSPIPVIR